MTGTVDSNTNVLPKDIDTKIHTNVAKVSFAGEASSLEVKKGEDFTTNDLIGKFQPINPMFAKFYANKTQRAAIEGIVKVYDAKWLANLLDALPDILSQPYAPRITTPAQLAEKLGELKQFTGQKRKEAHGKSKIAYVGEPIT